MKYKKRPSKDELAIFYYNRYVEAGKRGTLPFQTAKWVSELLKSYDKSVFSKEVDIKEVITTLKVSRNLERRVELEVKQ